MKWFLLPVLAVLGFALYVRLAPTDPARWHRPVEGQESRVFAAGVLRIEALNLADLAAVAAAWPRTRLLAGSIKEGRLTYVTRSRLWGFPDYTTIEQRPDGVAIYARLRFGRSDLGVNGERVKAWIAALGQ